VQLSENRSDPEFRPKSALTPNFAGLLLVKLALVFKIACDDALNFVTFASAIV